MIEYGRDQWWRICFSWRGTVLPYVLLRVGLMTGFCLLLCLLQEHVLKPRGIGFPALDPIGHSLLGVSLGLLIVFRTNSSNNRFWEARSHWGAILNTSRNLIRMAAVYAPPADRPAKLVTAYVLLLKEQLRDGKDLKSIRHLISGRELERLAAASNPAQVLAKSITQWVHERQAAGALDMLAASRLESLVGTLVDNQGGCEKIRRTPLPFVYAALIKQMLLVYLGTLPFVLVERMGFVAPLVLLGVSLGMLGIEEAGVEIEDPFGHDSNHLPLDAICAVVARDVADLSAPDPRD